MKSHVGTGAAWGRQEIARFFIEALGVYRLLDVADVAVWLNLTPDAIRSKVQRRQIPHKKMGRLVKFDPVRILEWLDAQNVEPLNTQAA